ncbi:MAG: TldD/PmbA family protein [Clostridia bacterium]|nr:TldD/PmbA family protein [Clostridia bacterium]
MTNTDIGRTALNLLQSKGADKAQCVVTASRKDEFNVESGKLSLLRTTFDRKLSMTAFVNGKKGSITTTAMDTASISSFCDECIISALSGVSDEAYDIAPAADERIFFQQSSEFDVEALFFRIREFLDDVNHEFPLIKFDQVICAYELKEEVYQNTNGTHYTVRSGCYSLDAMFSANDGKHSTSFNYDAILCNDLSKPFIEHGTIRNTLRNTVSMLYPRPLTGKFIGTLIMQPTCLESFLHMIVSSFTSDSVIIDGTSPWRYKLNEKVADKGFNLSVAPYHEGIICGERVTEYGFIAEDYDIIKDGILENFSLSYYGSNKTGLKRAGTTGSSYVVKKGNTPFSNIIAGIDRGIIVGRFSGDAPAASGDFSGIAKSSFLIENGQIVCPLTETMISGNLSDMLCNIRAISNEEYLNGYTSIPCIAFDGIVISGK